MRRGLIPALLVGFLLAGCGSSTPGNNNPQQSDATPNTVQDAQPDVTINSGPDAGCDEDAVGENYYIQNCTPGGNGTPILRQIPTNCQP
jgi:hypothetical protein